MDDKKFHDLALMYAHAKLMKEQNQQDYDQNGTTKEISNFLKWYHFALLHLSEEEKNIDLSVLC